MMLTATGLAVIKLGATLALILAGVRLHLGLALSVLIAALFLGLACALSPLSLGIVFVTVLTQEDFVLMAGVVFLVMALSRIQDVTGQNRRLVRGMSRCIPWPCLRLVIFPALIGLLPVPGGALFSCPMLKAAAGSMDVDDKRLVLVNYWFRHIWELACPLYPGYILTSFLLGMPLFALARLTFPLVFLSVFVGWFFLLRDIKGAERQNVSAASQEKWGETPSERAPIGPVVKDLIPLLSVFVGVGLYFNILNRIWPSLPSQYAFMAALGTGIFIALVQGRRELAVSAAGLFLNRSAGRVLFLILTIFVFKDIIAVTDIVADLAGLNLGACGLYFLFFLLPFICGALMGVMVGYVGASVPILMSLIGQTSLQDHTAPLIILALVSGNCGQLLSPLHVCLPVTCDFFQIRLGQVWKKLFRAVFVQFVGSLAWIAMLFLVRVSF